MKYVPFRLTVIETAEAQASEKELKTPDLSKAQLDELFKKESPEGESNKRTN